MLLLQSKCHVPPTKLGNSPFSDRSVAMQKMTAPASRLDACLRHHVVHTTAMQRRATAGGLRGVCIRHAVHPPTPRP